VANVYLCGSRFVVRCWWLPTLTGTSVSSTMLEKRFVTRQRECADLPKRLHSVFAHSDVILSPIHMSSVQPSIPGVWLTGVRSSCRANEYCHVVQSRQYASFIPSYLRRGTKRWTCTFSWTFVTPEGLVTAVCVTALTALEKLSDRDWHFVLRCIEVSQSFVIRIQLNVIMSKYVRPFCYSTVTPRSLPAVQPHTFRPFPSGHFQVYKHTGIREKWKCLHDFVSSKETICTSVCSVLMSVAQRCAGVQMCTRYRELEELGVLLVM